MPDERRKSMTDNLPPYAGAGREPAEQVAAQRISPSDASEREEVSDISSTEIISEAPRSEKASDGEERTYGKGAQLYGAYPNHNTMIDESTTHNGDMETTFGKIGDVPMPDSVPRDPAS